MIEFRALGTVEVHGVDPSDAEALRSHPHWVATLTCLLVRSSGAAWRRGELVSLLWSSVEASRGRSSLRVVLHALRRHLGHDAIVSRGDALHIDRSLLTCDVLVFEELLSRRLHDEALEVYGGDLLSGLTIRNAPRFESWLADRRASLRRSAAGAAWALSGAAERRGQWIGAVQYARRAVSLSMDSETAVRRLLQLLDRAGDGASALHEYRKFADRWRRELGVEPSAETRALVEEIRGRRADLEASPPGAVSGRKPERPPEGPSTRTDRWPDSGRIAVLPFVIDGEDPALEHLAAGLAHDVIASLARVSGIVVVARPAAAYSLGAVGRIPTETRRQLDADVVLDTSVRVVGDRFIFIGRLIDVRLDRPIWTEAYDGKRTDLLVIRRQLLRDVLAAAGVEMSAAERESLERGQTASPAAFELYLKARSRWSLRTTEDVEASIGLFEGALAIDPAYALAQAGLMDAYAAFHPAAGRRLSETKGLAREAARKALQLDPGLGEVHATLGLLRAFVDQDWDGAEADLRRAIDLSPGYASAHHWLGAFLTHVRRRFDEGGRELEISRQLDPHSPVIRAEIGLAHTNRGDLNGARRILGELMEEEPGFWRAPYFLGVTCFLAGDPESGTAHLRRAWRLGAFGAEPESSPIDETGGEDWPASLRRRLDRLETSALQPGIRAVEGALLSTFLGHRAEAIRWLQTVSEHSSAAWIMGFFPVFEPLAEDPGFQEFLVDAGLGGLAARAD